MPDPIPLQRPLLAEHITNEPAVREAAQALSSHCGRIARVLTSPAALPERRADAKAELIALAADALQLWSLL
jgi:hypothetical protein